MRLSTYKKRTEGQSANLYCSPSGIASNNCSSKFCSSTDQVCLYVSDFGFCARVSSWEGGSSAWLSTTAGSSSKGVGDCVERAEEQFVTLACDFDLGDGRTLAFFFGRSPSSSEHRGFLHIVFWSLPFTFKLGFDVFGGLSTTARLEVSALIFAFLLFRSLSPSPHESISTSPVSSSKSSLTKTTPRVVGKLNPLPPPLTFLFFSSRIFILSSNLLLSNGSISSSSSSESRWRAMVLFAILSKIGTRVSFFAVFTSTCSSDNGVCWVLEGPPLFLSRRETSVPKGVVSATQFDV